jgi:hypothetical protein
MSGQIFISYRREESQWSARSLHDRLCRDFDPKQIFMDIDAIGLGDDFVEVIETTVAKCDVLIAVIGKNWVTSKDDRGDRRLNNPEDFVRMEIGAALKRKIRVIPVLVDGALMPRSTDLPEDLKPLVRRNALAITGASFVGDCQRLVAAISKDLERAAAEERKRPEAEQREKERLETERCQREEKERLEAERRQREEQEGLEAEEKARRALQKATKEQVFISYSHKDTKWFEELETHLRPYLGRGSIKSWSDKQISPGTQWFTEIKTAFTNAKVAVLLVTPDLIASDFVHEYELGPFLKEARQGGVRMLWVHVRASSYKKTALRDYPPVLDPVLPLANMTDAERDRAWVRICEEIEKAVNPQ